jgi:hypothetical protein
MFYETVKRIKTNDFGYKNIDGNVRNRFVMNSAYFSSPCFSFLATKRFSFFSIFNS